ncbi:rabenosyn-5 [Cheilinus undulatus]|uniref:rabenosyn-5 n=1 Tax=Cheilinus undulatus TaxID=241271 RepID=UPI001BD5307F|nr:rabenosyn-5 [Cheilinus undulatus]XP_041655740.1 rabenosyn-5 [Cheilinus undulatus]
MASSYPSPFEGTGEVKEGFLCPLCLKDLQSFYQLQDHYEEEHSGEDRHVRGQLKSLVQKAKKAKDKLLKRDGEDRPDTGTYESFYYGGVDPYMWEPQELGATRNHVDFFKKHRAARIDHYVIEVNKLIIRLEKLISFDRINSDAAKIRAIEKSVVSWVNDSDVPFCPDCGNKFNIRNRRHHCRLCGSIMCRRCMEFVPLPLAQKLISGTREALSVTGSPGHSQSPPAVGGGGGMGSRRGSISSLSSVTSMLEEKDDEKIRCCHHCMDTLLKRQQKLEEKDRVPDVVKLYERLRMCMEKVDEKAPEYIRMAESLNAGETTYNLDTAGGLRLEVQKYYELIDALSKKILTLNAKDDPPPHPKALQLQRMVRYTATLFVQEKLLGLMSLPTKEKYEELKEKRKQEQEKRLQQERLAAQEALKRRQESERHRPSPNLNGELPQAPRAPRMTKAGGWLPSADSAHARTELEDPLLQQIENIQSFLRQAREAQRADEVAMLEENLRQLQDEYDQQQTSLAITLSQKLAQEESLQQSELQRLEAREREEREHWGPAVGSTQPSTWERSLDISPAGSFQEDKDTAEELTPKAERSPSSLRAFPALTSQEESPPRLRSLGGRVTPPGGEGQNSTSLNPFDEEDSTPVEEDPSNPFFEDIKKENQEETNGKKEYNPFDEDEDVEEDKQGNAIPGNPFEEEEDTDAGNPFLEASGDSPEVSTNPFDGDDDEVLPDVDMIEEELLLQQIDNIRAYIFDAKLSGRLDEVELLSENLRELLHTLQEQKRKKH